MKDVLIEIGFDKNGEADFGVYGHFAALSLEKLNQIRQIIPVAIYVAEEDWRLHNPPEEVSHE
jgi:hypothetical protein